MKYIAIIDEEMLSNFRIDEPPCYMSEDDKILAVKDELGYTRGIQLKPLKKGYWIERFKEEDKWLECSNCHLDSDEAYNFCPNCGAEMRGDDDEQT